MSKQPQYPTGHFGNASEFGKFMWGRGPGQAEARMETVTLDELKNHGVTLAIAEGCRDLCEEKMAIGRGGDSAPARKKLMERCIELLIAKEGQTNG